jgi:hypothetical protein
MPAGERVHAVNDVSFEVGAGEAPAHSVFPATATKRRRTGPYAVLPIRPGGRNLLLFFQCGPGAALSGGRSVMHTNYVIFFVTALLV